MLWPVTVVGALVGALGGALPGALLGAVVGHALDRHWRLRRWSDLPARLAELRTGDSGFERVLFLCLGRLAKASGRVSQQHLQLARELLRALPLPVVIALDALALFRNHAARAAGERDLRTSDLLWGLGNRRLPLELVERRLPAMRFVSYVRVREELRAQSPSRRRR